MEVGSKVRIQVPADHAVLTTSWFPKSGATGTIQKMFKNGTVAVAVDQLRNGSDDGKVTLHFSRQYLVPA